MSDMFLRARVRKRDKDIQQAIKRLDLEEGEMADMIRDGFRMKLKEMGALRQKPLTHDVNQLKDIFQQLLERR